MMAILLLAAAPVGLPAPKAIAGVRESDREPLARLLQELAWAAASEDPLSGLAGDRNQK